VFVDGDYSSILGAVSTCWRVAARLRRMQDEWDQLSPYEREYVIR